MPHLIRAAAPAITGRPVRFGLVGCGRISARHVEAIRAHAGRAELVAVSDPDPNALAATQASTGVPGFGSLPDLLAGAEVDCVVLATPSGLHASQTIEAARAGRHVVTEKPMATQWKDGLAMVEACDEAGVRLFVVKQNRRNPTIRALKRAIDGGRFGRIHLVTMSVLWSRPQSYYDQARWRGTWEFDGGAFMNQASHYVDLLDWLVGPVASVHAFTATLARRIEAEDTGVAILRWRSGALGSMSVTVLTHPKNYEGAITIVGDQGTVRVGGVAVNEIQHWVFADPHPDDALVQQVSYQTTSVYGHGHLGYYDNVIATLRGEAEPETDGREGLRSLELLVGIYRSARDGRTVSLPLDH
jgi:UDP-N-acetyl-2-amino-2-deoxyglucuronate dehydrogenase